jgi:glycosyltransferase involved in cell wall biosynthesis
MEEKKLKKLAIIPAFNEKESILATIRDIEEYAPDYDYIVVNDSSWDGMLKLCQSNNIKVLTLPINLGIGGAVQTGYVYAREKGYDIAIQFDGDGQHDARYIHEMERTLLEENADMVIGSRFLEKEGFQSSAIRRFGIRYFGWMAKSLFGQKITDPTSGMRMCNRKVIRLFEKSYPRDYPEPETVCRLLRKKCKVVEIPVRMRERQGGVSSISPKVAVYYMIKVTLAIWIERLR